MNNFSITITDLEKSYYYYKDKSIWDLIFNKSKNSIKVQALKKINLNLKSSNCYALFGKNGSGKSTLLKIISNTELLTNGSLNLPKMKIFPLLEENSFFENDMTLRENINFAFENFKISKKLQQKRLLQIQNFLEISNYDLDKLLKNFSKNFYVEISLVTGIFLNPDAILIDENFNFIRPKLKKKILFFLTKIKKSKLIIISSHDLIFLKSFCDKFIWLDEGKVKKFGNAEIIDEYISGYNDDPINFYLTNKNNIREKTFKSNEIININLILKKNFEYNLPLKIKIKLFFKKTLISYKDFNIVCDKKKLTISKIKPYILNSQNYKLTILCESPKINFSKEYYIDFSVDNTSREDLNTYDNLGAIFAPKIEWINDN
jgi:ABC-type polysaccharide/polyol phosphate transport system ATPase subunit